VTNWRARRAWDKCREELESHGEQIDFKAFIPKAVPDDQNFAALPLIQSWFIQRTDFSWNDNYSRAMRLAPKSDSKFKPSQRHLIDLVIWEQGFAAAQSGRADKPHASASPDAESRSKAAVSVLEAFKGDETLFA